MGEEETKMKRRLVAAVAVALGGGCTYKVEVDSGERDSFESKGVVNGVRFVRLEVGTFDMGCTEGQSSCESDESPVRTTTLTRAFYISETEVTQEQFEALMGYNPSTFNGCGPQCPVERLSWHESASFANAMSAEAGLPACYSCSGTGPGVLCTAPPSVYDCEGYRLPTEAEWEGAARCGEDLRYAGSDDIADVAWYYGNSGSTTQPVAALAPNACGLYDMSGNVFEWTNDWQSNSAYGSGAAADPTGNASGASRVFRGGSWNVGPESVGVARRSYSTPGVRHNFLGVRLVRTAP